MGPNQSVISTLTDGVLTGQEQRDLERVAVCLGLGTDAVARSLIRTDSCPRAELRSIQLQPGDRVVITGETKRPRDEWIASLFAAGLEHGGVTKATRVLVAADPDSLSGKAQKARTYGIPIVTEDAFERAFDEFCRSRVGPGVSASR